MACAHEWACCDDAPDECRLCGAWRTEAQYHLEIDGLRADLARADQRMAEAGETIARLTKERDEAREDTAWLHGLVEQTLHAVGTVHNETDGMLRKALRANVRGSAWDKLWGPDLEELGGAVDTIVAAAKARALAAEAERDALRARVARLEGAIQAAALDEYAPPNDGPRCGLCSSLLVVCDKWNTGKDARCAGPRLRAALPAEKGVG